MKTRSRCLSVGVVAAAVWLAAYPAAAQITLDADFDSGSLDEANSFAVGDTVFLAGRDNFNPGTWKWLHFAASGVQDQRPVFRIDDNFSSGPNRLDNHAMVYSYDRENWFFFDQNDRVASEGLFVFQNIQPFAQDTVYVAYGLPYLFQKVVDHTTQISTSPFVQPTISGGGGFSIGQSPGGIDDIGRVIDPSDLLAFKITDPAATGPKAKIVALAGTHPNETLANHTLQGMVDFLVSDDPRAAEIRAHAEVFVYPMVNPDGRVAGLNRSTVEHPDRDPNRVWREDLYADMGDIGTVAEAMKADTGGDVDYFIDFHSFTRTEQHFGFIDLDQGLQFDPFWQSLTDREPAIGVSDAALINSTAPKFAFDQLDAEFAMTFETEFIPGENIDRFLALGRNVALALGDAVVTADPDPAQGERFLFDDPAGTALSLAANEASARRFSADIAGAAVQDGVLRITKPGDNFAASYVDIPNEAGGRMYLVAEIAGWALTEYDPTEPEEFRVALMDSDGVTGSTITAQMELERTAADRFELIGMALGAGENLDETFGFAAERDQPLTLVLEVDLDADTYQVYFREGDGPFVALGTTDGALDPLRSANSLRLVVNNDFAGPGEFLDLASLELTFENPLLASIPGDLNGDGFVGAGDLDILLGLWNRSVVGSVPADLNGDGFIGAGDLDILLGNWNAGVSPGEAAPVPEPGAAVLVLVGLGAGCGRRCAGRSRPRAPGHAPRRLAWVG